MITIEKLEKIYTTDEVKTYALSDINLEFKQGEFVSIMGPSGSGKSTLLNIIGLVDDFDKGSYHLFGNEVVNYNENMKTRIRRDHIAFIFQNFNLIDELTVFENIELPLIYKNIKKRNRKAEVNQVLNNLNIYNRKNHLPHQLSGGQQQRVAICRAIIAKPKLILADEPTGNLDSIIGEDVMKLLIDLNMAGTTIINVTHSEYYAKKAHRVIYLSDGKIQDKGY